MKKITVFKLIGLALVFTMPFVAFNNGLHVDDGPFLTMFIVGLLLLFANGKYLD